MPVTIGELVLFWSICNLSSPPCTYFMDEQGYVHFGSLSIDGRELRINRTNCSGPHPIIGFHPKTHEYGHSFGEWRPMDQWVATWQR